ncbi:hypothetical protein [Paracoccus sp. NSM]|uniref:hypothetical protein n=1 Tax=Paracoccus sp. NSM TaxID=3457784 RepID=UPI00403751F6
MPSFVLNGLEFYDAPKNAGTTVRLWLKHAEGALPQAFSAEGYYALAGFGLPQDWTDRILGPQPFFNPGAPGNRRWCILRDPIQRFTSAYTDKILRENLANWSVETCLVMLESGEMDRIARAPFADPTERRLKLLACHFLGQHVWFGPDRTYFDHVFPITRMEEVHRFCEEEVFRMKLPHFHGRDQSRSGIERLVLSPDQIRRLERIHARDYELGWY